TSYREEKEPHIFSLNLETKKVKDLVKSEWISSNFMLGGEVRYNFSPDGKQICFMSTEDKNSAASTNADLYTMNSDGSNIKRITENKSWDGYPVYSPDGKYIAYKLQTIENFEADRYRLALYDLKTNQIKILTEDFDYTINEFEWSNDSKSIYFTADVKGYAPVHKIDITTSAITNLTGNQTVMGFDIEKSGVMIYAATNVDKPREIFTFNLDTKKYEQLTSFNKDLLDEYDFRPVEQMWIEGAEGIKVHTFIVKPHNFDPNKKYPLVLNVHGGPQSQWMDAFRGDWQVYGGYGYVIAFCNPHGSTGYGSKYTEAISGDYGGKVFDDLMNVTDELEKLPYVDKDRIGAMGWSFGGYMMNWFQAKTKRFKCLASMMGIFDSESMWGATEELWFVNWDMKGQPWNSDNYEKYSPSNYAKDFSTPTLIITGEKDYRVPYTQSVQYFTTLKTLGIDARLVVFPNDGHWPSSVKSMPLYYNSHLEWFNKYLGGEPAPYDSHKLIKGTQFK
ncbi:MAG: S9 family peptidase, partial [Syntrophothermus sp.]